MRYFKRDYPTKIKITTDSLANPTASVAATDSQVVIPVEKP